MEELLNSPDLSIVCVFGYDVTRALMDLGHLIFVSFLEALLTDIKGPQGTTDDEQRLDGYGHSLKAENLILAGKQSPTFNSFS